MSSSCLAIVLDGPKPKNGRKVFDSFVEANRSCFWNRELVAAMENMIYMGFMRPGTLFVSAPEKNLTALRTAWVTRILKPALGYRISSLGDMGAIQSVQQTHFVPLGDVLCDAIAHLNRTGRPATLRTVREHIHQCTPHVAPPSLEMMRQTVMGLTATGLVYQMGDHFFVSVPAHPSGSQQVPEHKISIECQTGESIIDAPVEKPEKKRFGILAKLFSRKDQHKAGSQNIPTFTAVLPTSTNSGWTSTAPRIIPTTLQKPAVPQVSVPLPPVATKYNSYVDHKGNAIVKRYNVAAAERKARRTHRRAERRERAISRSDSSSECLNYGPIDPPECLPVNAEIVDDIVCQQKRRRRNKRREQRDEPMLRSSTPVHHSDSAYSLSPVTTESEEPALGGDRLPSQYSSQESFPPGTSEPEDHLPADHTYMNLKPFRLDGSFRASGYRRHSIGGVTDVSRFMNTFDDTAADDESTQFEEFTLTQYCSPTPPPHPPRKYVNLISNL